MALDHAIEGWDDQELGEREEAAQTLGVEDPDVIIDYCHDCITLAEQSTKETRFMWDELLKGYAGKIDYSDKQEWQAKVTTGDLNSTVKQGVAVIRKALRQPDWYSIDPVGEEDKILADFLRQSFDFWLNPEHARFDTEFCDATELAFAIGQSHEIIPQWVNGHGLVLTRVPPWQIFRDPDAVPRDPQSGDFWAHMEWMDLWKVKKLGENPRYVRLDEVTANESAWGTENQDKRARRKNQYYQRTPSRHAVRVIEQWGVILDKQGELLLDNARFTIAGDVLIRNPESNPFVNLRWPGISFSPMPDLFGYEGHGIIETSYMLWLLTCNLMSLHVDDLSWRVNKMWELSRMSLEDPSDVSIYPGKLLLRSHEAAPGQPVAKEVYTNPSSTTETLATLQHWDQRRENSSFVNQFVAGQRGTRTQITKGEVELKTAQSMTIFDSLGQDIEEGAVNVLKAVKEVLLLSWSNYSSPSIERVFPNNQTALAFAEMPPEVKKELLRANCDIKITGISKELKNSELLPRLQWLMSQALSEVFGKYVKPYQLLKRATAALGFYDPDFVANEIEAKAVDKYWEQIAQIVEQMKIEEEMQNRPIEVRGGNGSAQAKVPATTPASPQ
jgi:hypothetical protein